MSSSSPPTTPSSASTDTPFACAYSTTVFVISMFSARGLDEASIMTDEKPASIAFLQFSKLVP